MNDSKPRCPKCGQPLTEIWYPLDSMLNRYQWESQLAGDLYCTCHNNHRGNKPYAYFWKSEFSPAASSVTGPAEREALRDPTPEELESPEFNAVWNAIKKWDISRTSNGRYAGANGTDVCTILDALKGARSAGDAPREWIPVSERLPEEEELVLFAARCQADDCDGITHTWNEVFRGSIYSTPQQIIATADNGDEYEGEEILGWQPFPAPPVVDSGAIPAEEEKR